MQVFNNLIKFPISAQFTSYWSNSTIAHYLNDGYLDLRVKRADYTLITQGQGVKTKQGLVSVFADKETKRIGFRVRVRSQSEDLYLALLEIANYTAGDCNLQPIKVLDYCYRHDRKDRDRGYRIRTGVFEGDFSQVSGTVTRGYIDCDGMQQGSSNRYGSGFTFKFMETINTGIYF